MTLRSAKNTRTRSDRERVYDHEKTSTWGLWVVDKWRGGGGHQVLRHIDVRCAALCASEEPEGEKAFGKESVKLWLKCRHLQASRVETSRRLTFIKKDFAVCKCMKIFSCLLIYVFIMWFLNKTAVILHCNPVNTFHLWRIAYYHFIILHNFRTNQWQVRRKITLNWCGKVQR